jgi:hypothetical protein
MRTVSSSPHSHQLLMDPILNQINSVQVPLLYFSWVLVPINMRWIIPRDLFSSDVSTKILYVFTTLPMVSVVHDLPIWSTRIWTSSWRRNITLTNILRHLVTAFGIAISLSTHTHTHTERQCQVTNYISIYRTYLLKKRKYGIRMQFTRVSLN